MNNFTYKSQEEKDDLERILRKRRRKINRQQIVAGTILALVIGVLVWYIGRQVVYTEFDGYIHVDENKVRTPFDIYLDSMYVTTGDIVMPGDTLYSYYMMEILTEQANINTEPAIIGKHRDLAIRYNTIVHEMEVQKVKIGQLRNQIALENHNIQFGLSNNSHRMDLERQLAEAAAQLRAMQGELEMLGSMREETNPERRGLASFSHSDTQLQVYDQHPGSGDNTRRYRLATDSAIIINIQAPDRMVFFEKELILSSQHLDLEGNNLHVVAYIPPENIKNITYNSQVQIVVNNDVSFDAHVSVIGMRTEEIPEHLRSYFTKKNTALIANLALDEDQKIPFWTVSSGLPVTVRVKNMETWQSKAPSNYLWVETGHGITDESLEQYVGRKRRYSVLERAREQQIRDSIAAAQEAERQRQADAAKKFVIVTNSFQAEAGADLRVEELRQGGYPTADKVFALNKWLVFAARYADRDEAQNALNKLSSNREFRDAWILDTNESQKDTQNAISD